MIMNLAHLGLLAVAIACVYSASESEVIMLLYHES